MSPDYANIVAKLEALRNNPPSGRVFGSDTHDFKMHPPLGEAAIREFETMHRVVLPTEYREFLKYVGNGGAGPAYGLFRLGQVDDGFEYSDWRENDGFIGILSEPFPHSAPWNNLEGEPDFEALHKGQPVSDEDYDRLFATWEAKYFNTQNINGAIPICHLGCALRQWLVITGSERGNVWNDHRADHRGVFPVTGALGERITFLMWYQNWLNDAVVKSRR
jgi:hypothetical protein